MIPFDPNEFGRLSPLLRSISQILLPPDFEGVKPWVGRRPVSPDGLPYVGRFRRYKNLIAACGHAMLGVTLAPATGQLVAEIAAGREPSFPVDLLDPNRYV